MKKAERLQLFNRIFLRYCREMWIHAGDCGKDRRAYSIISRREIILPGDSFTNPSEWDILILLHEIGHVLTNKDSMRVYEKEYLATQWSADAAKEWGLHVIPLWKDAFREYILEKRQMCLNRGGKNVPDEDELAINW
jgi:hypothetical protein